MVPRARGAAAEGQKEPTADAGSQERGSRQLPRASTKLPTSLRSLTRASKSTRHPPGPRGPRNRTGLGGWGGHASLTSDGLRLRRRGCAGRKALRIGGSEPGRGEVWWTSRPGRKSIESKSTLPVQIGDTILTGGGRRAPVYLRAIAALVERSPATWLSLARGGAALRRGARESAGCALC